MIETKRLILRTWNSDDIEPYFQINQDPNVFEFLLGPITRKQAGEFIQKQNRFFQECRFCAFAVEIKACKSLAGFIGLGVPEFEAHFTPCVEIAWRLGSQHQNKGYATEGAKAVLDYGFNIIGLDEIVAFTVSKNKRSIRVMEKLGMSTTHGTDFAHPSLPLDHPLSHHVLYKITRSHIKD